MEITACVAGRISGKPLENISLPPHGASAGEFGAWRCDIPGMPLADFIHLRVHTAYSLSAGAIPVKEAVRLCKVDRMPAVAITDTGNLVRCARIRHRLRVGGGAADHRL